MTWAQFSAGHAAAAAEFSLIASTMGLAAPSASSSVKVFTDGAGTNTYTMALNPIPAAKAKAKAAAPGRDKLTVSVDEAGNPVGEASLPFAVFSTAIQDGINALAPAGMGLFSNSMQLVKVRTLFGATSYSTTFSRPGSVTKVAVTAAGSPATMPYKSADLFFNSPMNAQLGILSLANALGYVGDIDAIAPIAVFNEGNGQSIYTITLPVSTTLANGRTVNYMITISVDQDGNPTTMPDIDDGFAHSGRPHR
jgi:hypothetical protein